MLLPQTTPEAIPRPHLRCQTHLSAAPSLTQLTTPVPKMSTLSGPGAAERPREGVVVGVEELLHLSPERYAGARGRVGELRRPVVHLGPVPCRGR